MIDCRRAYIGTKMELKPEAFKGKMFSKYVIIRICPQLYFSDTLFS